MLVGRSELVHVAIGYDGAVLDPSYRGNKAWPLIPYIEQYPGLTRIFEVPVARPVDLERYPLNRRKAIWPTLLRMSTLTMSGPTEDCVCIVADALRRAGVPVPHSILTPRGLHDWLNRRYRHATV